MNFVKFFGLWIPLNVIARRRRFDLVIFYVPTVSSLLCALLIGRNIVYDCVVDWRSAPPDWYAPRFSAIAESLISVLARFGVVRITTDSQKISDRFLSQGAAATVVPPAVDEPFRNFAWTKGTQRVAGYFGSTRYSETDVETLIQLSRDGYDVEIVGPIDVRSLDLLSQSSVRIYPPLILDDLTRVIDRWSIILLPYRNTDRSSTLVPAKLWNALSTRKRVLYSGISLPSQISAYTVASPVEGMSAVRLGEFLELPTWRGALLSMKGE